MYRTRCSKFAHVLRAGLSAALVGSAAGLGAGGLATGPKSGLGSTLRQPETDRVNARRPEPTMTSWPMARRPAGRNHSRVGQLAAHPRLGRRRGLVIIRCFGRRSAVVTSKTKRTGTAVRARGWRSALAARLQPGVVAAVKQ